MAGEVSHVIYGARLLSFLGEENIKQPSFWAGTLFPDIRHLGIISRQITHPKDIDLKSLTGGSDFATGLRVHAWIDSTREKFLRQADVKDALPWHPFVPHALKLFEDEILYDQYSAWPDIDLILDTVYPEEIMYVADEVVIKRWHDILRLYFGQKPNDDSRYQLSLDIGLSKNSAKEINSLVRKLKADQSVSELVNKFLLHLESLLIK
jgi:hypothetical protein